MFWMHWFRHCTSSNRDINEWYQELDYLSFKRNLGRRRHWYYKNHLQKPTEKDSFLSGWLKRPCYRSIAGSLQDLIPDSVYSNNFIWFNTLQLKKYWKLQNRNAERLERVLDKVNTLTKKLTDFYKTKLARCRKTKLKTLSNIQNERSYTDSG